MPINRFVKVFFFLVFVLSTDTKHFRALKCRRTDWKNIMADEFKTMA